MAINIGVAEPVQNVEAPRFMCLDQFVVDVDNMTAFKKNCAVGTLFRVVRTEHNDRARSRLTDRKPFDLSAAFQSAKSSFFAKTYGEFAGMWYNQCNGGKYPTARQVFVGVWQFYSSHWT